MEEQPKRASLLWDLMLRTHSGCPDIARYRRLANALVQLGRMQMQGPQLRGLGRGNSLPNVYYALVGAVGAKVSHRRAS